MGRGGTDGSARGVTPKVGTPSRRPETRGEGRPETRDGRPETRGDDGGGVRVVGWGSAEGGPVAQGSQVSPPWAVQQRSGVLALFERREEPPSQECVFICTLAHGDSFSQPFSPPRTRYKGKSENSRSTRVTKS
jgi:hypothetical protein